MFFLYLILIFAAAYLVNLVFKTGVQQGMKAGFKESEKRDRIKKDICRLEGFKEASEAFTKALDQFKKELVETRDYAEFKKRENEELQRKAKIDALIQQTMIERQAQMLGGMFGSSSMLESNLRRASGLGTPTFDSTFWQTCLGYLQAKEKKDE